mmetsp:Transcript_6872/g.14911  ORF Transcript_6872/g.14911 Transcript_6872/m.14911 type:complete len:235 (-) Transcript_6872:133-837(-)
MIQNHLTPRLKQTHEQRKDEQTRNISPRMTHYRPVILRIRTLEVGHQIVQNQHRHELQQRRHDVQENRVPHPPKPETPPKHHGQIGRRRSELPDPVPFLLRRIGRQFVQFGLVPFAIPVVDDLRSRHLGEPIGAHAVVTRLGAIAFGGWAHVVGVEDLRRAELEERGEVEEEPRGDAVGFVFSREFEGHGIDRDGGVVGGGWLGDVNFFGGRHYRCCCSLLFFDGFFIPCGLFG